MTGSVLGDNVIWKNQYITSYVTTLTQQQNRLRNIFDDIFDAVSKNQPIYLHCQGGNDRTETVCMLILGVLGVSEFDIAKDYECSTFAGKYTRTSNSPFYPYADTINVIKARDGDSLQDKINDYFINELGYSQSKIDEFKALMIK